MPAKRIALSLYPPTRASSRPAQHPASQLAAGDKRWTRPGGRPFVFNDHVFYWTQDASGAYGNGMHLFRVLNLTRHVYAQQRVHSLIPPDNRDGDGPLPRFASHRHHHVDVQRVGPGEYFALYDGDRRH